MSIEEAIRRASKGCWGKKRYPSERVAKEAMRTWNAKKIGTRPLRRAYACDGCPYWHATTQ